MSILIRGMEMPKSCWQCQLLEGHRDDGLCKAANRWLDDDEYFGWYQYPEGDIDIDKPLNCPLVEINDEKIVKVATLEDVRDAVNWAVGEIKSGMDWVETNDLKGYPLKEIIALAESEGK